MISIVIPLYNKEQQISQTLETVLKQSFKNFEVVIVDDGSTDGSVEVVRQFADPRIRLIQQKNAGVSAARNRGVDEAKGEFVAFLDADDLWHPDYLATQMALVEKYPDCDVYATNYEFADSKGRVTPTILRKLSFDGEDGVLHNYFEVASCSHPPITSISIMVRKSAMEAIGGFPLGIKSGEDLLTWARLAIRFKIAYSRHPYATFVQSEYQTKDTSKSALRLGGEERIINDLKLMILDCNESQKRDLQAYICRWYKIYCVLLIEAQCNRRVARVALEAIRYGGSKITFSLLSCFALLPSRIANNLFIKLRR